MGEINFLENNGSSDTTNSSGKKIKSAKLVKTKDASSEKASSVFWFKKNRQKDINDEKRVGKSRQEVLEMIDNNKKAGDNVKNKKKEKPVKNSNKTTVKSLSWIKKIFDKDEKGIKKKIINKQEKPAIIDKRRENDKNNVEEKANNKNKKKQKQLNVPVSGSSKVINNKVKPLPKLDNNGDSPFAFNSNTWNNSGVLETNLIDKSEYSFHDSSRKIKYIMISVFGAITIACLLYLGLLYFEYTEFLKLESIKDDIVSLEDEIVELENDLDEAKNFQGKLSTTNALLIEHVYWTRFFDFLEEITLKEVYYHGDLELNIFESINLPIRFPNYETLKNQLLVFANDNRIVGLKKENDTVVYSDDVSVVDKVFDIDANVSISLNATSTEKILENGLESRISIEIDNDIIFKTGEDTLLLKE